MNLQLTAISARDFDELLKLLGPNKVNIRFGKPPRMNRDTFEIIYDEVTIEFKPEDYDLVIKVVGFLKGTDH